MNKKSFVFLTIFNVVGLMGIGMLLGHIITNRIKSGPKIEIKEVVKEVSPCDKAFHDDEKAMCFAKEACGGKLKDFHYDGSWSGKITFNCGE